MNNVWVKTGNSFSVREVSQQVPNLPVGVYKLQMSPMRQLYLDRIGDNFEFPYHIYGMEKMFISRVIKSWNATHNNMGILLNGIKGTGKTVTGQLICNKMNLPVIIISFADDALLDFLNNIQQDVIILIDEYEKIFNTTSMLLSIMDGVFKSRNRLMFIFTTNELHIEQNLLQRPSRIRYIKTFEDMSLEVIMEVVNDKLIHKSLFDPTVKFISEMPIITMDLVKSVVEEVNIHEESPYVFADVFNIYDNKEDLVDVYLVIDGEKKLFKNFCRVNPSYFTNYSIGKPFEINDWRLGMITSIASSTDLSVKTLKMSILENSIENGDYDNPYQTAYLEFFKIFRDKAVKQVRVDQDEELSLDYTTLELPSMTLQIILEPAVKKHKSFTSYIL